MLYFPILLTCISALEIQFWWFRWATLAVALYVAVRITCRSMPEPHMLKWKEANVSVPPPPDADLLFFIHGWPDDERIWDRIMQHFSSRCICIAVTLPNFGDAPASHPLGYTDLGDAPASHPLGYTRDTLVDCLALTLKEVLHVSGRTKCILVGHDWGSILAMDLQRKRPELVRKMIIHDVECRMWDASQHYSKLPSVIMLGIGYQWWLVVAFLLSTIPVLGTTCGALMTRQMARALGGPLPMSESGRPRIHAGMNYLYLYVYVDFYLELLGLRRDFDQRHSIEETEADEVPTLFMYSGTGLVLHSRSFVREMRDRQDCDIVALTKESVDHWYIYKSPEVCVPVMRKWLETGEKQGNYDIPVVGMWE